MGRKLTTPAPTLAPNPPPTRKRAAAALLARGVPPRLSVSGLCLILPADADALLDEFFDFERDAVCLGAADEVGVNLEDAHLDEVFDGEVVEPLVAHFGDELGRDL